MPDNPNALADSVQRDSSPQVLKVPEAARYLRLSVATLNRYRGTGTGPAYSQPFAGGPVRYRRADLDDWLQGHSRRSTSETLRDAAA